MDTKRIGKFISENRKRKGLTQEQLGELLGVTNKTISRWENGNYMPDLSLLVPLSETLDISLNELLNGKYITEDKIMETTEYACTREKKDFYWYYDFWRISMFCCICDIR